jgi:ABC-type antimicrobial peptide transport system permease subunit
MNPGQFQFPKWTQRFLRSICPEHLLEEIEGDLLQRLFRDIKSHGEKKARRKLIWNVMRYIRPGILLRHSPTINLTSLYMLTNYFKVAFRVMSRSKTYSAINIAGLAFGITGATLLFLWIAHEFSYDQFHHNKDQIYMAWNREKVEGQWNCWRVTPRVLAPTLANDFTGIEAAISYAQYSDSYLFSAGETRIMKDNVQFTDPGFLTLFSFPLIKGDAAHAMADPNAIVMTESFARQLFGDHEAFGETLTVSLSGLEFPFTVTGILKDLPSNTDFDFEFLIPFQFLESLGEKDENWFNNSVTTFVKIRKGTNVDELNSAIKDIKKTHTSGAEDTEVFLYAFTKNHLYSRFENGVPSGGRIVIVGMLGILGVCLVVIACINFINLSTARAQRRAREVAVRKVSGAYRRSLVFQFLSESFLITLCAGFLSLIAIYVALPFFNTLVEQELTIDFYNMSFWIGLFALLVVVGILSGSYPALYLSSFQPIGVLKGATISSSGKNTLRSMLVVFQFGFSIVMIVSTLVVRKQIDFVHNRETGYARDNLVYHSLTGDLGKKYTTYKNELLQSGAAISVTKTSSPITQRLSSTSGLRWTGKDPQDKTNFERFFIDENISTTAGFTIIEGRDMDLRKFTSDSSAVILNETAVKVMGLKNPIGEIVKDDDREYHVVGVIKDFVLTSPYQQVEPMVLLGSKTQWAFNTVHIKLNPANTTKENISKLSKVFSKYNPEYPFEYHFVDVEYERKFSGMKSTLAITTLFTSIAIFIACLGLLGLSTYMAESRIKEIGIRKVLGGSVLNITKLLGLSSIKPILISFVAFSPMAWLAMDWWLNSYAYRVSLDVWIFLVAGLSILSIALITIGAQTIRAARTNPVNSLRNE